MKRGDIYTAAAGGSFGSKPRPVLIIQGDAYPTAKRLVAMIGSPFDNAFPLRVLIEPDPVNNLQWTSAIMVDVLQAIRAHQFGTFVGRLHEEDMRRVDESLLLVLGFVQAS